MHKILIIHGPNLNLLGTREPTIYGKSTLADINLMLENYVSKEPITLDFLQCNAEHEIINRIHQALIEKVEFIIINPGAFTHTSIALRDAFLGVQIPFIEVHLSNIHKRENFRKHSYLADIAVGQICGLGKFGYVYALNYAKEILVNKTIN